MAFKATGWHVETWQILNVTNFLPTFDHCEFDFMYNFDESMRDGFDDSEIDENIFILSTIRFV